MAQKYTYVVSFRCTDEERSIVEDVVASYPGMKTGTALREFFMSGDVLEIIRRRSAAYRAREQVVAAAALRALLEEDDAPDTTPSAPPE